MRNALQAFYQPSDAEFKAAWGEAIFVLDTNILLNLYRYPLQPRDELLTILKELGDRIWIPFHVGLEYQRNRLKVIIQQQARFTEVKNELTTTISSLRGRIGGKKQHSIINVEPILKQMEELVKNFNDSLAGLQISDVGTLNIDPIRDALDTIFEGRIGLPPNVDSLDNLKKIANSRYSHSIPPGYADVPKEKRDSSEYVYGGNQYESKHGDFIIWSQIIEHARQKKITKVIFLTDDEKEDWFQVIETPKGKRKEPRVELIDEIRREADVTFFYMYNSESFLKHSKQYLQATVQETSIAQVADVLNLQRPVARGLRRQMLRPDSDLSKVVLEWLDHSRYLIDFPLNGRITLVSKEHTVDVQIIFPGDNAELKFIAAELSGGLYRRSLIRPSLIVVVTTENLIDVVDAAFGGLNDLDPLQSVIFGELRRKNVHPLDTKESPSGNPVLFLPLYGVGNIASEVMNQRLNID